MLYLVRWIIEVQGEPLIAQVDLLRSQVIPIRRRQIHHSSYVSRQGDRTVWLTAFASEEETSLLQHSVSFDRCSWSVERNTTDRLLYPDAGFYRQRLHEATDLASDLLTAGELVAHQRFLTHSICSGIAVPEVLAAYLEAYSLTHREWSGDQKRDFWAGFYAEGPADGLSCYGHWLWNLVVGPQPHPGQDPLHFLKLIGIV